MKPPVSIKGSMTPARGRQARAADVAAQRRLRVAIVVEAAAGGIATHLADLLPGLAKRGVEVHLIARPDGDRFDSHWLTADCLASCSTVTRLPMQRAIGARDLVSFARLYRTLAALRPDLVHSHSSKAGVLARACRGPWRHVYTPHAVFTLNPTLGAVARRAIGAVEGGFGRRLTDRIIAVSDDEARHLHEDLHIGRPRIATIHNGVPEFERVSREAARRRLGLRDDAFVVGLVGRFAFQKGIDRFVSIARQVEERLGRRVQFVCIGSGDFCAAAGVALDALPANLHVVGAVPNARRYFGAFDLCALPSRYEGFPYVYVESVAAGVPIVSTRVAGADALVAARDTGVVVPNHDDPTPFAEAVIALATDAQRLARLRSNCASAAAHFTSERMVDETLAVYRQCIHA
ncbi:glycosyltransferase family 4 protein [Caballeronia sp. LZ033]|uniref:glycosyltransferase family 4 protein n=1 Tax=Caballeronia sp. LZ033 TaxID=3038566 RepID=UPI0028627B66|nr:glycosyltransferase family 4 protein [Caballeronia sp. LZ033]MDR5814793.1 glycosyltransferase family 4 protein [Caballeronia sp. LZ033]